MKSTKVQTLGALQSYAQGLASREKAWPRELRIMCTSAAHAYFTASEKWPTHGPYNAGSAGSLQQSGFREILTNFLIFVARWVRVWFSGRIDAQEVRCWTDTHTHRQTDRPNYSNPRCTCMPRVNDPQSSLINLIIVIWCHMTVTWCKWPRL